MNALIKLICKTIFISAFFVVSVSAKTNEVDRVEFFYNGKLSTQAMIFLDDSIKPNVFSSTNGDIVSVKIFMPRTKLNSNVSSSRFFSQINSLKLLNYASINSNYKLKNGQKGLLISLKFDQEKAFVKFASIDSRRFRLEVFSREELVKIENNVDGPVLMALNSDVISLGLKKKNINDFRIVIDPGHGGDDYGAKANGLVEKKVVLDVALRTKSFLEKRGFKVFLTRSSDKYVSLLERSQLAEKLNADLFISLHANSAGSNTRAEGIESFRPTSRALGIGKNEMVFGKTQGTKNPSEVVHSLMRKKVDLSNNLAQSIQSSLFNLLHKNKLDMIDRGVKKQSFLVLLRGEFPSVLVEIGFLTNKDEANLIANKNYRTMISYGISKGISKFVKNFDILI
jgi:N-acetylmuramoyl-L-alanine amidase